MGLLVESFNSKQYHTFEDSGIDWVGNIPKHWEIKKFKRVFKEVKKRTDTELNCGSISFGKVVYKDDEKIPESTKRSYQVLKTGEFLINPLNLNYDLISLRIALSDKDVVVSSGYIVIDNFIELNKTYFNYFLHRFDVAFMKLLGSGVRQTLNWNDIANCDLILPPLQEQTAIAEFLDRKTALIDQAIDIKQKQIELLKERRQILINRAVTRGLNPNAKMKDSGVKWIGRIPEGWIITSVKNVLDIPICDGPHTTPQLYDDGYPFVSAEAIKNGEIDFDKIRGFISLKDHQMFSKKYSPKRNDIYMVKSGATTGNVAMVRTDIEFSIWSPLAVFRANQQKVIPNYLLNYLESPSFKLGVELNWSFGTQQNIGMGVLSNLPIAYPSIEEQSMISQYIGQVTSKVKSAIALKEREIERLKEYKATLINSAVTGKIKVNNDAK
jgi:type I restriction enzyme S subunit